MFKMPGSVKEITKTETYQLVEALKPFLDDNGKEAAQNAVGLLNLIKIYDILSEQNGGNIMNMFSKGNEGNLLKTISKFDPAQIEQMMKLISLLSKNSGENESGREGEEREERKERHGFRRRHRDRNEIVVHSQSSEEHHHGRGDDRDE